MSSVIILDEQMNWELMRFIDAERLLGNFDLRPGEVLVVDSECDARSATLIAALCEAIEAAGESLAGVFIEARIGCNTLRFRVVYDCDVSPLVYHVIGAGAVMLRYENQTTV